MRSVVGFLVLGLFLYGSAEASPIVLTSGGFLVGISHFSGTGPLALAGEDFSYFQPIAVDFPPVYGPWVCTCFGGEFVSLQFSTDDLQNGTAVYQGNTYITGPGGGGGNSLVGAGFLASVVLPIVYDGTFTTTVPLAVLGEFLYPLGRVPIQGSGTVTVSFSSVSTVFQGADTPAWKFQSAQYDIVPVPEPTSLLLLGSGISSMVVLARPRRAQRSRG